MATEMKKVSSTLNENYNVTSDEFVGTVNAVKNETTGDLTNLNGQLYVKKSDGTQGAYVGNFSGTLRDGSMVYTTSQMTREQYTSVMELIGEIEAQLLA